MVNPAGAQGAGVIRNYLAGGFTAWRNVYGADSTPLQELFDSLGSVTNPDDMVNCQDAINGMKSRVWGMRNPVETRRWGRLFNRPKFKDFEAAAGAIQHVRGVWSYLNHGSVEGPMLSVHEKVLEVLEDFDTLYRRQYRTDHGSDPTTDSLAQQWRDFMNLRMPVMVAFSREWVELRIGSLRETWTNYAASLLGQFDDNSGNASTPDDIVVAFRNLEILDNWENEVESKIDFPAQKF